MENGSTNGERKVTLSAGLSVGVVFVVLLKLDSVIGPHLVQIGNNWLRKHAE